MVPLEQSQKLIVPCALVLIVHEHPLKIDHSVSPLNLDEQEQVPQED